MSDSWSIVVANYHDTLEILAAAVAILILISSVDDLLIDLWYWGRRIYRTFTVERTYRPLTAAQLRERTEQPLAIMVPAWLEYDVIAPMIENMVSILEYRNYVIFIGTYLNDLETIGEVERMQRRYKQLHRVEVPHPGPTCKADCLNWIVKNIFVHERESGIEFAGVVLHDSEDVLHPLELKLFNYLLPRKDMIQLPVASLEREWFELVAGTYMDEFAESHAKDMVVRESVSGVVPSAGVGTCFSRRAVQALITSTHDMPFNTDSLTEDYDVGNRLAQLGMQSIFAVFPVKFRVKRKKLFRADSERELTIDMPLCVREYFPDTFRLAYRQKARWVLGIGLQSWEQLRLQGPLVARYLMLRDRKSIVTAFISIMAYLLVLQFVLFHVGSVTGLWRPYYPPLFSDRGWWRTVIILNACFLVIRAGHRVYFTSALYGWEHGLMSLPRMVVSNFVNFMAVARAWRMYLSYLFKGTQLAWDKTMHEFPSGTDLLRKRQRLGDLLKSWQAVDDHEISDALAEQDLTHLPLGRVLVSHGWLDEETLAEAIAYQSDLPRAKLTEELVAVSSRMLPPEEAIRFRTVYLGVDMQGVPLLAVASPLLVDDYAHLELLLGKPPLQRIVRESEIVTALRLLRGFDERFDAFDEGAVAVPLLGDLLIGQRMIEREVFELAMRDYNPGKHGRIGDYLVDQGVIRRASIESALELQRESYARRQVSLT